MSGMQAEEKEDLGCSAEFYKVTHHDSPPEWEPAQDPSEDALTGRGCSLYEHLLCAHTSIVGIYIKWLMEPFLHSHYVHLSGKVIQNIESHAQKSLGQLVGVLSTNLNSVDSKTCFPGLLSPFYLPWPCKA